AGNVEIVVESPRDAQSLPITPTKIGSELAAYQPFILRRQCDFLKRMRTGGQEQMRLLGASIAKPQTRRDGHAFEREIFVENEIGRSPVRIQDTSAHHRQPWKLLRGALVQTNVKVIETKLVRCRSIQGLRFRHQV